MAYGLQISGGEQTITVDKWRAVLRFNIFYNFWYYDLYRGTQLLLAGQRLTLNSYPAHLETYPFPKLFLVDTEPTNPNPVDMMNDFGKRLELSMTDYIED